MSSSSPAAIRVSGCGTKVWPLRMIRVMTLGSGSRSSSTVTPCSRDGDCTVIVSNSASNTSSGAASTWISRVASFGNQTQPVGERAQARTLHQGEHHHQDEHDVEQAEAVGDAPDDREGRQHDRHGTAQAGPGHENLLAPGHPESGERDDDGQRPGDAAAGPAR